MTEVGSAYVTILPSMKGFGSKIASQSNKASSSAGKSAGTTFAGGFKKVIGPVSLGFAAIKAAKVFGGFIADARESAKVGAITASVIKSTGGAAGLTAKQVGDLSTAISNKTGIDDEQIQSNANVLLTFTKVHDEVGRGNQIFSRATGLAQDMATVLGTDAAGASIQLGKALNDPIKGITALSRAGVSFTQGQKDRIKKLVEEGNVLKAQKIILHEVTTEFGGAAAAAATPMEKLRVTLGNLGEQVGARLIPVIDRGALGVQAFIRAVQTGAAQGQGFIGFMSELGAKTRAAFNYMRDVAIPTMKDLGERVLPQARQSMASISHSVQIVAGAFRTGSGSARQMGQGVDKVAFAAKVVSGLIKQVEINIRVLAIAFRVSTAAPLFLARVLNGPVLSATRAVIGAFNSCRSTVASFGQAASHAASAVTSAVGRIGSAVRSIEARVQAAVSGASTWLLNAGRAVVQGLINGINSKIGEVAGAIGKVAGAVKHAFPNSPAAKEGPLKGVHFDGVGSNMMTDLAAGIRKGGKTAVEAIHTVAENITGRLSSLRDAAASVRTSVADSVRGIVDVSALATPIVTGQDAAGNDITRTPALSETFAGFAAQAKAFAAALATMARKKVSPAIIAAIAAAGPASGLTAAQSFANASTAEIASVNKSMGEIQSAAGAAGNTVLNTTRIPADIKREQAQLDALNRIEGALKANNVAEIRVRNGNDLYVVFKRAEKAAKGR